MMAFGLGLGMTLSRGGGAYTVERFIADMTADGQWSTLDAAYVFDPASGAYEDLTSNNRDLTVTATVTQFSGLGVKGDGVTGKLLGLGALTGLVNGTQNDTAVTFMITKAGNQLGHMGRVNAAGQLTLALGPIDISVRLQASANVSAGDVSNSVGASTLWRTQSGTIHAAKDQSYLGSVSSTSATPTASPIAILQNNTTYSTDTVFAVLVGKGISQAQALRRNSWLNQLAQSRGWRPIPAVRDMGTISAVSSVAHPDQTEFVPTGLFPDGSGGFWSCNDGRTDEADTSFNGGIRHYTDATLASYTDFRLSSGALATHFSGLGISTTTLSVQGGCLLASGQVQFVCKDTAGSNSRVVRMDADGTNVSSWATNSGSNGLCFDPVQGLSGLMGGAFISWRDPTTGTVTARTGGAEYTSTQGLRDQVWISTDGEWMLTSSGNNDEAGILTSWSLVNDWGCPVAARFVRLGDTFAIEGVCATDLLYVNSDTGFHKPTPPRPQVSQMQTYPIGELFDPF